jgi:uncharacterized protein
LRADFCFLGIFTMNETSSPPAESPQRRWQPLQAIDRRVAGVLVEKAKTTPDAYPMTVNAIRTACNQKNNRYPLMEVEAEDVEESLARLRALGVVGEIQGSGRANKYRHHLYDWLGVEKVEMAVMAELLLRGTQTEGELRGRAARMEPIADVAALRPVITALKAKGLVISLTSVGRGHVVTHALYEARELEKVRREFENAAPADEPEQREARPVERVTHAAERGPAAHEHASAAMPSATTSAHAASAAAQHDSTALAALRSELGEMQAELARLRKDVDDLWSHFR